MIRWAVGLVRRALGTLLLLLLLVSGAEVGVRILEVQSPRLLGTLRSPSPWESLTAPSWTVRQELRPLTTLRVKSPEGGPSHALRTNSFGIRGEEVALPKPSNIYRVVCLGDESLLGAQQPEENHLCTHLQERIQAQTKLQVEVCNAGVPGACPVTEFLLLRHRLSALQPDLVVLVLQESDLADDFRYRRYVRYDAEGVPLTCRHSSLSRKPRTDALSAWRQEFRLIDLGLHWAGDTWKRQTELDGLSDADHLRHDLARLRADRPAIDHALQPLVPLAAWCRRSYASLCVLNVPDLHHDSSPSVSSANPFFAALQELAAVQQFLLVEAARSEPTINTRGGTGWSSAEHRAFALQVAERLLAETAGPWSSPYFQPEQKPIAPVSLELRGDRQPRR